MPLYRRGVAPIDITLGRRGALRASLGQRVIWDGTTPVTIAAPPMRASATMPTPTLVVGVAPTAPPMTAAATMPAPEISAGASVTAPPLAGEATMPAPALSVGVTIEMPPMTAYATMPAPAVGETVVEAPPMTAYATVPTPEISTGVTVLPEPLEATASMPAPDIGAGVTITMPPMTAAATMPAPDILMGVTHADDFNRASLDGNWVTIGTLAPVIAGGSHVQAGTGGAINAVASYVSRYATAVSTDTHRSRGTLATPTGTFSATYGAGLWVRGTTAGDRVEATFTPSSVSIATKIGGTSTTRETQAGLTIPTGAAVELAAAGNVYTAYADGVPLKSWTDTGGVIAIGATTRSVGITLFSHRSFSSTYTYGWALDDWVGRDG